MEWVSPGSNFRFKWMIKVNGNVLLMYGKRKLTSVKRKCGVEEKEEGWWLVDTARNRNGLLILSHSLGAARYLEYIVVSRWIFWEIFNHYLYDVSHLYLHVNMNKSASDALLISRGRAPTLVTWLHVTRGQPRSRWLCMASTVFSRDWLILLNVYDLVWLYWVFESWNLLIVS